MGQIANISPKGIIRNTPDSSCVDGSLLEAINIRFRDGAWSGIGEKKATGYYAESVFILDGIAYHPALPVNTYVVHNSADNKIYTVLFTNGSAVQVSTAVLTLESGEVFSRFSHLGNVLFVFTDRRKYLLYWDVKTLAYINLTKLPQPNMQVVSIPTTDDLDYFIAEFNIPEPVGLVETGVGSVVEEYIKNQVMSSYYLKMDSYKTLNYITGVFLLRIAYKLFDGTYINHSIPISVSISPTTGTYFIPVIAYWTVTGGYHATMRGIAVSKNIFKYDFFNAVDFNFKDYYDAGIIESMDIFCTEPFVTRDYNPNSMVWGHTTLPSGAIALTPNLRPEFNTIIEDAVFYKMHSIPVSDLVKTTNNVGKYGRIELDFSKIVSTNELMPADDFSHHGINALADYQYNSRMHLGNVSILPTLPLDNSVNPPVIGIKADLSGLELPVEGTDSSLIVSYDPYTGLDIRCRVYIKTANGVVIVDGPVPKNRPETEADGVTITGIFTPANYSYAFFTDSTNNYIALRNLISYPDYRAYKMRFYYTYLGIKYVLADFDLKPATNMNIAYFGTIPESTTSNVINLTMPLTLTAGTVYTDTDWNITNIIRDTNRMQVSEIFNTFILPAKNSYRFGLIHNELIDISTVQSQMSDSAFGMYPIYVFTRSGVYAIQHGTGEVLYQSIQPLNNEILISRGSLCAISGSIVFACKEGIRVITGSNRPEEISIPVEGSINNPLALLPYYYDALTGFRLPQINNYRTGVTFLTYIQAAKIFYDVENKEIIVSNPAYLYSYAYSLFTESWATRTDVFTDVLVIAGRQIAVKRSSAMDGDTLVYTSSLHYLDTEDTTTGLCDYMLMQTRPLNFSNSANKHINKLISRCRVITKNQENAIQIVVGSNDLITWQIISYVQYSGDQANMINTNPSGNFKYFVIAIAGERKGFYLNQIDIDWKERFNDKLR